MTPTRPAGPGRPARGERGSVTLLGATLMTVMLLASALTVDLGMQRVVRSDMQAVADMVALDLSSLIDGRSAATITAGSGSKPSLATATSRSLARNAAALGVTPTLDVRLVRLDATGKAIAGTDGLPSAVTGTTVPQGVWVRARGSIAYALRPGSGAASRSALAGVAASACYKIGSWALAASTSDSLLLDPVLRQMAMQSGAFTDGAAVSALSYRGLATARVNLAQLATGLGVGTVDQLATATVSLRSLYTQVALLATPSSTTNTTALNTLAAKAKTGVTVSMGSLLQAKSGAGALLDATANVLDLVGGGIVLMNGSTVANTYLASALGSLSWVNLAVKLLQGPHQYCGRPGDDTTIGVASQTEQLNVHIDGTLAPTTIDFIPPAITGLLSNVTSARITAENHISIDVSAAGTASKLTVVTCSPGAGITLDVTNGLATVTMSTPLRAEVRASLLGIAKAVIAINAAVTIKATLSPNGVVGLSIQVPPKAYDTAYPTSSGSLSITSITRSYGNVSANVELLGGLLGAWISLSASQQTQLLDTVLTSGINSLLSPTDPRSLSTTVFTPILQLIGARVGGSDVILDGTPPVSCGVPRLMG